MMFNYEHVTLLFVTICVGKYRYFLVEGLCTHANAL